VIPGFSHNVFWINHLNSNFSTTPRFTTEIITDTITRIIPGDIIPGQIIGYRDVIIGQGDPIVTPIYGDDFLGWKPTDANVGVYVPGTSNTPPGVGGNTMLGWVRNNRIEYLMSTGMSEADAILRADADIAAMIMAKREGETLIPFKISTHPKVVYSGESQCQSGNNTECRKILIVTDTNCNHPTNCDKGAPGDWKPEFEGGEESNKREIIGYDTEDNPIYGEEPVYGPDEQEDDEIIEEEVDKEIIARVKKEWKISFAPAYFIDYDFGKLVLNQAGSDVGGRTPASVKGRALRSPVLYKDKFKNKKGRPPALPIPRIELNNDGPFLVKKSFQINAGMGGSMAANYANAGTLSQLSISVSLIPTIGGGAKTTRMVDTTEEAKKAKQLSLPSKVDDFSNWKVGDQLEYDVHGGIVFSGGVGFYGLAAGVSYVAQGLWKKTYRKNGANEIFARLDKNKMMSFGAYLAAGLVSLSINKFISSENGFTFTFNTSTQKGRRLLILFMKGKMNEVQEAARNESDPTVMAGFKIKGKTGGWGAGAGIGIPYLPASARWNKSNFLSESKTTFMGGKRFKKDTVYGKIITFSGRFFPFFTNYVDGFFANVRIYKGAREKFMGTVKTGQYSYNFQKSYTRVSQLKKVIKKLKDKTGLIDFLNVEFPEGLKKVGSAELKFGIKFKTAATQFLIAQRDTLHFENISKGFVDSYFAALKNPGPVDIYNYCAVDWKIYRNRCRKNFAKETRKAIKKMKKALRKMASVDGSGANSRETLAKAYVDFGQAMTKNPFTLQTVLNMTLGRGADVFYSIETTKTKKYEAILRWVPMKKRR